MIRFITNARNLSNEIYCIGFGCKSLNLIFIFLLPWDDPVCWNELILRNKISPWHVTFSVSTVLVVNIIALHLIAFKHFIAFFNYMTNWESFMFRRSEPNPCSNLRGFDEDSGAEGGGGGGGGGGAGVGLVEACSFFWSSSTGPSNTHTVTKQL